jgi:hypothetical protein
MLRARPENASVAAHGIIDKTTLDRSNTCDGIVEKLRGQLANGNDWSVRAGALETAVAHLTNDTCTVFPEFSALAVGVASCVTDPRSSLVRAATNFVIACAQVLQKRYVTSIKSIIPALFKPLTSGTAIIADSCHEALLAIAAYVQHRRTIAALLPYATSRSKEHRLVVAESFIAIADGWPETAYSSVFEDFQRAASALSNDAAVEVRRTMRRGRQEAALAELAARKRSSARSPRQRQIPVAKLPAALEVPDTCALGKPKLIPNRAYPKDEHRGIESVMPPRTAPQAEAFLRFLNEISLDESRISGSLIGQSVLTAAEFIPQYEDWESVIPQLFHTFPDSFLEIISDLFHSFRFDSALFICACDAFTVEKLIEKFVAPENSLQEQAIKFFIALIQSEKEFVLTEDLEMYLRQLVRNSNQHGLVEPLKVFFRTVVDLRNAVDDFLERIINAQEFSRQLEKLRQFPNLVDCERELEKKFLKILTCGNDTQRQNVITAVAALSELSFVSLRNSLLQFVADDKSRYHEKALGCLAGLLDTQRIAVQMMEIVKDGDEAKERAVLSVILRFASEAKKERLLTLIGTMFVYLNGRMQCDIVPLRRLATLVLVECSLKLGEQFEPFRKRISTSHQRLIELYIAKRAKTETPSQWT